MIYGDECVQCGESMIGEDGKYLGGYMQDHRDEDENMVLLKMCWKCAMHDGSFLLKDGATLKDGKYLIESENQNRA